MESDTTYSFRLKDSLLGAQMLFVAFGALVLVPILTGMSTNVALFTAGVGTLIFQICTRGKVPVFLASSFAFIAPIIYGVQTWGLPATLGGMVVAGAVYVVLSFIIRWRGTEIIMRLLPPIVTGPVIIVIGLVLAPVGVNMALGKAGDGSAVLVPENTALIISMAALATTVLVSLLGRGMIRLIPIMSGIAVGYLVPSGSASTISARWPPRRGSAFRISCSPSSAGKPSCSSSPLPLPRPLSISGTSSPSAR